MLAGLRNKPVTLLALIVSAAAAAGALYVLTFHPSRERYPVRGIDVSHHQGPIDWDRVAEAGIRFAYIKATEGGDLVDRRFVENWRGAHRAGLARGAYHFFTLCRPGTEQAANFMATVPRTDDAMPPAVDLEFTGNCTDRTRWLDAFAELSQFLERVESYYGRKAVLYVRPDFYAAYLKGQTINNPLWLQGFILKPSYGERAWSFWQYHAFGRIEGIAGPVDRNVFRGDPEEFAAWIKGGESHSLADKAAHRR